MFRCQLSVVLSGTLLCAALARAATECSFEPRPPPDEPAFPRHHPVGRELPRDSGYRQPTACGEGVWFYDQDRNGRADPAEPRLFGAERRIACASCHGESPPPDSAAATSVFLRQDASRLCLVCHNI